MADGIRILSQSGASAVNDAGKFVPVIRTRFMVGPDGPFTVDQDEATFDPDQQAALVNAKAQLILRARGAFGG